MKLPSPLYGIQQAGEPEKAAKIVMLLLVLIAVSEYERLDSQVSHGA